MSAILTKHILARALIAESQHSMHGWLSTSQLVPFMIQPIYIFVVMNKTAYLNNISA